MYPAGHVEPAPLMEAGMVAGTPHYGRLVVFPCDKSLLDLLGPTGAFGSSTTPLLLRGIVGVYSHT